ncbi:dioxygenase family protein [Lysobacter silvisoli]|uniref:Dioxygenase n=1 Tax=Lysobacter silvisoli TaxID=2293254 RepID=A0A371K415_9GAMM|nr:class III extradiol ring-cleavage dioxygenase [Lysobacter silvisoli]RDZ28671.1 dioxygenase [Lysobacter silvisoli]
MTRAPALFVSHGSPMFALQPGQLGPRLRRLGTGLEGVRAVLVVSPHWQSRGVRVMTTPRPATVHDFGGFAPELYQLQYPAAGAPAIANDAIGLLAAAGFDVAADAARGYDHGAWVPLRHLLPGADLPVFQVSMPHDLDTAGAMRLGAALAPLREQGVLIVGSGSLTHNLHEFRRDIRDPEYAQQFASWVDEAVLAGDAASLLDYRRRAPQAQRAHPTEEHYLPLLVALGASHGGETPLRIPGGITDGVLSMDSFGWGLPASAGSGLAEAA